MDDYKSDGSDSEYEESPSTFNFNSYVLVAIDCNDSMFLEDKSLDGFSAFQTAFQALHRINDGLILKKSNKNKLAVMLFHPDETKRICVDFDTPFLDALLKTQTVSKESLSDLMEYSRGSNTNYSFSQFLIDCKKKLNKLNKTDRRYLYFITNNADPCYGDAAVKFQALQEFKDFQQCNIKFALLPLIENLDETVFYSEAYMNYGSVKPKFYYNLHFLTAKIREAITFKSTRRNIRLYISGKGNSYIECSQINCTTKAKLLPNKSILKDTEEEVFKKYETSKNEKFELLLNSDLSDPIKIDNVEKYSIQRTPNVKKGLTIIYGTNERLSTLGENLKTSCLLKSNKKDEQKFQALWLSCAKKCFYLQCYLKHKEDGNIYCVELIPKMLNEEKHFLVCVMPYATNYSIPTQEPVEFSKNNEMKSLFDDLVKKGTIKNYAPSKYKPYSFEKQMKYFKNELLKSNFTDSEASMDFVNTNQYEGDVSEIMERLNQLFPSLQGTKRGKSTAGKTTKRGKKD